MVVLLQSINNESDIDVAILAENKVDSNKIFELIGLLTNEINRDIDLVQLDKVSTVLQFQIIQTGKRIFCTDEKYCNAYESQIFCDYVELNELRKPYIEEIAKTGKILS